MPSSGGAPLDAHTAPSSTSANDEADDADGEAAAMVEVENWVRAQGTFEQLAKPKPRPRTPFASVRPCRDQQRTRKPPQQVTRWRTAGATVWRCRRNAIMAC